MPLLAVERVLPVTGLEPGDPDGRARREALGDARLRDGDLVEVALPSSETSRPTVDRATFGLSRSMARSPVFLLISFGSGAVATNTVAV